MSEHLPTPIFAHQGKPSRRVTKLNGQKPALKMKEVWAIRARPELTRRIRDLALFNLAIDSKLRGCDLVELKVEDVVAAGEVKRRGIIVQKKTGQPVQFEITEQTRVAVMILIPQQASIGSDYDNQSSHSGHRLSRVAGPQRHGDFGIPQDPRRECVANGLNLPSLRTADLSRSSFQY